MGRIYAVTTRQARPRHSAGVRIRQPDHGHVFTRNSLKLSQLTPQCSGVQSRQANAQEDASPPIVHVLHDVGAESRDESVVAGIVGLHLVELGDQILGIGVVAQ